MQIFVGLGNPGAKYARNRHNIGFMALDRIAEDHGFAPWRAKFQGQMTEGRLGSEKVLLLKPETFMNRSGQAVGEMMRFYKLEPEDIVVFHDELDLAPGKCRFKRGGGHAGHNGLRSIHGHIGETYARIRLGIGHPGRKEAVPGYVLHDFPRADDEWLMPLMDGISNGASELAAGDSGKFQNAVALKVAPPRSSKSKPEQTPAEQPQKSGKAAQPTTKPAKSEAQKPADQGTDKRSALQKLMDKFS